MTQKKCNNSCESKKSEKCESSSSSSSSCDSSSSSSSEICYKVKCEKKCGEKCEAKCLDCIDPRELVCLKKNAVVELHSEFILLSVTGSTGPVSSNPEDLPLGQNRADIILETSGFFVKHCGRRLIIAPAHAVLMPPSLTSVAIRYPFQDAQRNIGQMQDKMVRASRILGSVFNVNNKGCSFVYELKLIGVDGAADIAVLEVDGHDCNQWNQCNPKIHECHPYFKFGCSKKSQEGEKVYLLGDYIGHATKQFKSVGAISDGLLSDPRHLEYSGSILPELVLVSAPAYAPSSGLPILNCKGEVIGMQTTDLAAVQDAAIFAADSLSATGTAALTGSATGAISATGAFTATGTGATGTPPIFADVTVTGTVTVSGVADLDVGVTGAIAVTGTVAEQLLTIQKGFGFVAGPSQRFMEKIIDTLAEANNGYCKCRKQCCNDCRVETICDPAGAYVRYKKGYLGLAYNVFTGVDYDVTRDYTSGAINAPRIRLDADGKFLSSPKDKSLAGIRVLGLAGLNPNDSAASVANGYFYVPGGTGSAPLPSFLPISPLLNILTPGDLIVKLEGFTLGDLEHQVAPSLITWRKCADDLVEVCYRHGGNALNNGSLNDDAGNYTQDSVVTSCLADYPKFLDYPWYHVNSFPLLSASPYPAFVFPATQLTYPQVPQLGGTVTGAQFAVSL